MDEGIKLLMRFTIISEIYKMMKDQAAYECDEYYKKWCGKLPDKPFISPYQEQLLKAGRLKNKLLEKMSRMVYPTFDEEMKTNE